MELVPKVFLILSGVFMTTGLYHCLFAIRGVNRTVHLLFSLTSWMISISTLLTLSLYTTQSVEVFLITHHVHMAISPFVFILYSWYITAFCKIRTRLLLPLISLAIILLTIFYGTSSSSIMYTDIQGLKTTVLPWGEHINGLLGSVGVVGYVWHFSLTLLMVFAFWASCQLHRRKKQTRGPLLLGICHLIFMGGFLFDICLEIFHFPWFYMSDFGFLALVGFMGFSVAHELHTATEAQTKLDETENERNRLISILEESEKTYRNIIDTSPMGMHMYHLEDNQRLVFVGSNKAADTLLGLDNSQFIGKTIEEAFPPLANTEIPFQYRQAATTGKPWFTEQIDYQDEKIKGAFEVHVFQTAPQKITAMFSDITKRKRQEEALRESEERYRQLFESSPDSIGTMDLQGLITHCNGKTVTMLGFSEKNEIIGKKAFDFIVPEERKKAKLFLSKRLESEFLGSVEYTFMKKNGERFPVSLSAGVLRDAQKTPISIVSILKDITDIKKAQEEARLRQQQLIQADKLSSIGLTVSGVAHEINNPNSLIMMNAGVLQTFWKKIHLILCQDGFQSIHHELVGMPLEAACLEFDRLLTGIVSGSHRIQTIVLDLKNFARVEPNVKSKDISLEKVITTSCSLVNTLIKKSTNHFTISHGKNVPSIYGNVQKLEQVLINILTNACQALRSKEDSIELTTRYHKVKETIAIRIRDTGVGIAEDDIIHVMDSFFTTKKEMGGTGLGLSVSYGIIKEHGGSIRVKSQKGKGTTFTIHIPVTEQNNPSKKKQASLKRPVLYSG